MTNEILVLLLIIVGLALIIALLHIGILNNELELRELKQAVEHVRRLHAAMDGLDDALRRMRNEKDMSDTEEHEEK